MNPNVERLMEALGKRADVLGVGSLTPDERTLVTVFWAWPVIENGGFRYFMEFESGGLGDAAKCFRALGLDAAADALEEARRILNLEGREPLDLAERRRIHHSIDWGTLSDTEDEFYDGVKEIEAAIEAYARQRGLLARAEGN